MSVCTGVTHWLLLFALTFAGACAKPRVNPSFNLSQSQARAVIRQMKDQPKPLERPLVILGGFSDPIGAPIFRAICDDLFADRRIIAVSFADCTSFAQCRARVIAAVDRAFPTDDPDETTEVDVIGLSMGGLVGRVSAEPRDDQARRRLRVARLFTISSPLRGAKLARFPLVLTSIHRDMRAGSALLRRLNASEPGYEIYCYTRLHDRTVGEHLASPAGRDPWWLDASPVVGAHLGAAMDKRILADIARRLRGEEPFTTTPPAPVPTTAN
jgi:pimeloyl-ACP methyl ester carboxylesterase